MVEFAVSLHVFLIIFGPNYRFWEVPGVGDDVVTDAVEKSVQQ